MVLKVMPKTKNEGGRFAARYTARVGIDID